MLEQPNFQNFFNQSVQIHFDQQGSSSDGGLFLVRSVMNQLRMSEQMSPLIHDGREPSRMIHQQEDQITQRLLQMCAGYEDVNDATSLRTDPVFRLLTRGGKKRKLGKRLSKKKNLRKSSDKESASKVLASAPTLCRLENRVKRSNIEALIILQVELYLQRNTKRFSDEKNLTISIDLDPTDVETHGQQPFAFYNGHYEHTAYLPMMIVDGDNQDLIAVIPRPGNRHATWMLRLIFRRLFARIEQDYPNVKFRIRADSGFQSENFFSFLEKRVEVQTATLSISSNKNLEKFTQVAVQEYKHADENRTDKAIELTQFGECGYRASSWTKFRRIIYQIQKTHYGTIEVRYYMTLDHNSSPESVKINYNRRAEAENRIKEFKTQAFGSRVSGESFLVNAFRMVLSGFCLIIFQQLRKCLEHTVLKNACVQTIREKLIKVAAIIRVSTRRILISLPSSYPYQTIWQQFSHSF